MPYLSRIRIYPIKSLDPIELQEVEIGIHSLLNDRAYAMLAEDGGFMNGKRTGRVNQLKASFDLAKQEVSLSERGSVHTNTLALKEKNEYLETFLKEFFGLPITLLHRTHGELMDIPDVSSVTLVTEASLQLLQTDLASHSLEDLRLRIRSNLEISGVEAFWEDSLFMEPGTGVRFMIGNVEMIGISPRARCNVPPRDPLTGETDKAFIRSMMKSRAASLPNGSHLAEYGNFYQLTVNTHIPDTEQGKMIHVGDELSIIGPVALA